MNGDTEAGERQHLLAHHPENRRLSHIIHEGDVHSIISSRVSKEEQALAGTAVGERLGYDDYTTIDWLHDCVKESFRFRAARTQPGIRGRFLALFDSVQGWVAALIIGALTACVAFLVDIAVATVSDWKYGYCSTAIFDNRERCCTDRSPLLKRADLGDECADWKAWRTDFTSAFGIYVGFALLFGILAGSVTMLTKTSMPAASVETLAKDVHAENVVVGKTMYTAAGSGIPEIKTILSGFVIPNFLTYKTLVVKAVGAVFAVATGMCLGKEGPFVHISTCVGSIVVNWFPKYRDNGRKYREMLSTACSAGLSVAFGAPIGGVLFSYEEISTYFPRRTLWKAFLCSLTAAVVLKALNPNGTGKLVLFETHYATGYGAVHYLAFVLLGVVGGIWGGLFCKLNFIWSKFFRKYAIIKKYPVFETFLIVLCTALLQYPNPMTREPGEIIIKQLLVDCRHPHNSWVCASEASEDKKPYIGWLVYGTLVKLLLTIITFGIKVPSGIIIPALDGGAFFGRLVGQAIPSISPGIFAMVGAAGFLAGVSRMTLSLAVVMFELTGELEYVLPNMIAILVAKWVADAIEKEGVYDLAQTVLGHPFLDLEQAMGAVSKENALVEDLVPPKQTMAEITVNVRHDGTVSREVLKQKLGQLKRRGLMDAGLVLVQNEMLQGYLAEAELEFGLRELGEDDKIRLLSGGDDGIDMSVFVDRTPLTIAQNAPMEYLLEMFGKLGLRYLCITEEGTGKLVGVVIKKRLIMYLEGLKH